MNISERLKHCRTEDGQGYCHICGKFGKLSRDHVPPKSAVKPSQIEQKLVTEIMPDNNIRGIIGAHGSTFQTICKECNGTLLSVFDLEIKKVVDGLKGEIQSSLSDIYRVYNQIRYPIDAVKLTKGIIGHILSAVPYKLCKDEIIDTPLYTPMREYVLGKKESYENDYEILYWFYPHKLNIAGSGFVIKDRTKENECGLSICACLYFYPIAFLIVQKGKSFSELSFANTLEIDNRYVYLNITAKNIRKSAFPFFGLDHTFLALDNSSVTVSYPKK